MTAVNERRGTSQAVARQLEAVAPWQRRYARALLYVDISAVLLAVGLAQWLRFDGPFYVEARQSNLHYTAISVVIAACWVSALSINRSRSPGVIGAGAEEYRRVWVGTLATFGGVAIVSMLFKLEIARGYLLIAMPVGLTLMLFLRWTARRALARARDEGRCITRVLAVGSAHAVRELTKSLDREPWAGYRVVGACVPGSEVGADLEITEDRAVTVFGDESHVVGAVTATGSHTVAVAATDRLHGRGLRDLSWELEKLNVGLLVAPGVIDIAGPRLQMRPVAGLPLIHVEKPQYRGAKRLQKRLFDVVFAGSVLLLGLPAMATIAMAIKLTSRGPVFYRQERIGIDGQPFEMRKFRTMVDGADAMLDELRSLNNSTTGVLFKIREDPRVTPVGRFLRKFSLDEVPQFINVLKRDMSVVGPRPPLASEVRTYDDHTRRRLLVRPGITGLWQISGRSDLSWEDSVRLDLFYVENWSMMADFVIAVKTARAVFCHRGAY